MGYYRGDYYRGDYYRGDFLGLGGAFKAVTGFVSKLGIPVVSGAAGIANRIVGGSGGSALQRFAQGPNSNRPGPMIQPPNQYGLINIGGYNYNGGGGGGGGGSSSTAPIVRGYHLNRSTYETRGGGTSRWGGAGNLQIHPKGTVLVRNRHRNVGNARALKHALSRVSGFARLARRVMSFTAPGHGRGKFKFRRRKK